MTLARAMARISSWHTETRRIGAIQSANQRFPTLFGRTFHLLHLFHVMWCRCFMATHAIPCVFSCHLWMPYFAGDTMGIKWPRHGLSHQTSGFSMKNSRPATVCHGLSRIETGPLKSTPSNAASHCSHLMAIDGLPSNDLKMWGFYKRSQIPGSFAYIRCIFCAMDSQGLVWSGLISFRNNC